MRSSKRSRGRLGTMKVIFIKLIGGPKVTIAFFLACGLFLLLSLITKPRDVIHLSTRNGSIDTRKDRGPLDEEGNDPNKALPGHSEDVLWEASTFASGLPEPDCMPGKILLILAMSSPEQFENRRAVRNTWGTMKKLPGPHYHQTVFVVGLPTDDRQRLKLEEENDKCGDILFVNVEEGSGNTTLKVNYALHWAWTQCRPSYLLKTDDDCFVNVKLLTNMLSTEHNRVSYGLYVGHTANAVYPAGKVKKERQAPGNHLSFKGKHPFASGKGYLLSGDVLGSLVALAPYIPLLKTADEYVGLLVHLSGVTLRDSGRFTFYSSKWQVCNFLYLLVLHGVKPEEQYLCLRYSDESNKTCAGQAPTPTGWV